MNPLIQLKKATPVFLLALVCFGLLPTLRAVSPPPDGGYPGGNTAEGQNALFSLTTGGFNTAVGFLSLRSDATGSFNTAIGAGTLLANTADENTATGAAALLSNTTGFQNTANGAFALFKNTTGSYNTATGFQALPANTIGTFNTANGAFALFSNTAGNNNTASGAGALSFSTTGDDNTAIGYQTLDNNTTGNANTAIGFQALDNNTTGGDNTAIGFHALFTNSAGNGNTATGIGALSGNTTGGANTAVGPQALASNTTGSANTAIGNAALSNSTTGSGNIVLGQGGADIISASNVICIGSDGMDVSSTTWINNIYGVTPISGTTAPVVVSSDGQLGTVVSSERFKKDISTMEKTSVPILALRPVTFHYKSDTKNTPQFGLIAEEVAKVDPALVLPDKEGKPYTVRYDAVNAMLLNEFLKEHRTVQQQGATIARLQKQIETLSAGLQKVTAQFAAASPSGLEVGKTAPQAVLNQ